VNTPTITAYVSLGSNLGDRAGNLLLAVRGMLEASLMVSRLSGIYETEPKDVESPDNFLNMVAEVQLTSVTPEQMLARMIRIEYLLGRRNKFLNMPRTVDLDLLFYGGLHYQSDFLTLPHPRLHERKFVLVPLAELTPHLIHPVLNRSIVDLVESSTDSGSVKRWNPNHANISAADGKNVGVATI
jgi:2-amino-4-hydroxy-6-hydroxymethyldihydropteridine diphosphokinase